MNDYHYGEGPYEYGPRNEYRREEARARTRRQQGYVGMALLLSALGISVWQVTDPTYPTLAISGAIVLFVWAWALLGKAG